MKKVLLLSALAVLLLTGVAQASVVVYEDSPSNYDGFSNWVAALSHPYQLIDFTVYSGGILTPVVGSSPVTVTTTNGMVFTDPSYPRFEDWVDTAINFTTFTFSGPTYSFGAVTWDMSPDGYSEYLMISLYNGATLIGSATIPSVVPSTGTPVGGFWGIVSTDPFSAVTVSGAINIGTRETYLMQQMVYDTVPEPTTYLLLGIGLGTVALCRRQLRKR